MDGYVELQATSNYSFLRGGSHPWEMVEAAAALGHRAAAITDRNTLAGAPRAHVAARAAGLPLVVGARLDLVDGASLLCLPTRRAAYGRLSRLLTLGNLRGAKAECRLARADVRDFAEGQVLVAIPPDGAVPPRRFAEELADWAARLPGAVFLAASTRHRGDDDARLDALAALAAAAGAPLVATNDALYHRPDRRPLQDVLTCIREGTRIDRAGFLLEANAERCLKPPEEMARLFRRHPGAVARTVDIAARCRFSLDELRYEYPDATAAPGRTAQEELEARTREGAAERYPDGVPAAVETQLREELALVGRLDYAPYFLTVHDIVRFAKSRKILCQGRGSAANSAVCYCLGVTAVDPGRSDLLFARFISEERGEPPDIDVDFEHERREEVIQHIYETYGRERAGLAATAIRYRTRSALRDVGKAMGLTADTTAALASHVRGRGEGDRGGDGDGSASRAADAARAREAGLDPADRTLRLALELARRLSGFPRHLSQHVGGFVIARGRLDELVPIGNAAMAGRTVIEWDKDDLDALGILKVDVLALGMLTCMRKGFDLIRRHHGRDLTPATVPADDPAVYDMLCEGDSLGVFQVESRAQMAMLPRLRPRCFYDLVIEVAIVRPGPIQGDMVHPYLRRRNGEEPVEYPSEDLRRVLEKTLGVPLFQEQAMKIAIVAAGFTPSEADKLRRAMATFRKTGQIGAFERKMVEGMAARGYDRGFAARCFRQIEGFGDYGFPESHAASFALLVYVSSWMKRHCPAAFAAALLNSQPMGFYAPAQIVRDARDHGVAVLPPDINRVGWDCDLEPDRPDWPALRLGLRRIAGLRREDADRIAARRGDGYATPRDLARRAEVGPACLEALARGDAFGSMGLSRREAFWAARGLAAEADAPAGGAAAALPLFRAAQGARGPGRAGPAEEGRPLGVEPETVLPPAPLGEEVADDYDALGLSLKAHPLALLRGVLAAGGRRPCAALDGLGNGRRVRLAGLVLARQRPGTARGVVFVTLEDETGVANLVVWPDRFERFRRAVLNARLLGVDGRVQREGRVVHVVAEGLEDLTPELARLADAGPPPDARGPPPQPLRVHPRRMRKTLRVASRDFH